MPEALQALRAEIQIDGSPLGLDVEPLVEQVIVDNDVQFPDAFLIVFNDRDHDVLDQARISIGSKVEIKGTSLRSQQSELLISGEVTSLGAEYHSGASRIMVRGYDRSHRLQRGTRTQTYLGQKDSDIAQVVAGLAGLDIGTIDDSGEVHKWVAQLNQSDWEFLGGRAREIGFELTVIDGKLNFRKPTAASDAPGSGEYGSTNPYQLVYGEDLLQFRPRLTASEQVGKIKVYGWNRLTKEELIGSADAATTSAAVPSTPADMAADFDTATYFGASHPYDTQAAVDARAQVLADRIGSAFAEADGMARGEPMLRAGTAVNVAAVSTPFAGQYTLSRTRHVFDQDGYGTEFHVSGRSDRSLLGLTRGALESPDAERLARIPGLVPAIVTDNNDPDGQGRVLLRFPWLGPKADTPAVSPWAPVVQFGAGNGRGAMFIPEVDDEVLVGFDHGNVDHPYVLGGLYNGVDLPPLQDDLIDSSVGQVNQRGFVSRLGHQIVFLDSDAKSGITLATAQGKISFELSEAKGELHIKVDGKIVIESTGDLQLTAQGSLQLSGSAGVKIESSATVEVSGSMIKLN
jgi:phage protein D/phage baseplate assembly protein gpV